MKDRETIKNLIAHLKELKAKAKTIADGAQSMEYVFESDLKPALQDYEKTIEGMDDVSYRTILSDEADTAISDLYHECSVQSPPIWTNALIGDAETAAEIIGNEIERLEREDCE